jgi:dipeptidyl-peptidase-4
MSTNEYCNGNLTAGSLRDPGSRRDPAGICSMHLRVSVLVCGLLCCVVASAQSRLESLPGYERYKLVSDALEGLAKQGRISRVKWSDDGSTLAFHYLEKDFRFDLKTRELTEFGDGDEDASTTQPASRPWERAGVGRGQQRGQETSPDGKWTAISRDWNVIIEPVEEAGEPIRVTTTGTRKFRYGRASWVYGEELDQHEAMWWSLDSTKLAFYEFDERQVKDFPLLKGWADLRPEEIVEGYPKPGEPNPIAALLVYDVATKKTIRVDTGGDLDQYVYNVQFSPQGDELIFSRTNRHQNVLEVMAASITSGESRVIVREEQTKWQENRPEMRFLKDGRRFIWESEKAGTKQYELRDLDGSFIGTLTRGERPVNDIRHLDETAGVLFYTAFTDANPLNVQLHRVDLDGTNDVQLTSNGFTHAVEVSPDGQWFITRFETIDKPPTTALHDAWGRFVATLAESDDSKLRELNLPAPDLFSFTADDGRTKLYGMLHKPSDFDSSRKYPLVIDVYGGPFTQAVRNRYAPTKPECEFGWLIAEIDNRGTINRGKAFESAAYLGLGGVDLRDQVQGVRELCERPYVDAARVGIHGHSYGGFMSALAILKYPDVFHAAVAGSAVTDWRNYDSIYTERYMRTPKENTAGYDDGSCMKLAEQLQGKLLLIHGMVDDNVHPTNFWQLANALNKAGKPYEMFLLADADHSLGRATNFNRIEFLQRHLVTNSHASSPALESTHVESSSSARTPQAQQSDQHP